MESEIGEVIRFHRRQAELSQLELAKIAGVGKTVVFDLEKGKTSVRLSTLLKVLRALNIRLDWTSPLKEPFRKRELESKDHGNDEKGPDSGSR